MTLDAIERAERRALQRWQAGDYGAAADELLLAAERAVRLAERTRDASWRQHLVDASEEYQHLAREIMARAPAPRAAAGSSADSRPASQRQSHQPDSGSDDKRRQDWSLVERPNLKLADVAGMDRLKEFVTSRIVEPLRHPEVYDAYKIPRGFGVLMYGPPGTGKTYFARAVAGELDCAFFAMNANELVSKWVGETEKNLAALMAQAKAEPRSVVFVDEIDSLFPARGSGSTISDRSVGTFLSLLDGLQPVENWMLVIGATNHPRAVDPALIRGGRLGYHVYVGLPDLPMREAVLRIEMKGITLEDDVDLAAIAGAMEGYSAADVALVAREARLGAARRTARDREARGVGAEEPVEVRLTKEDLDIAFQSNPPRQIPRAILREIEEFQREHGS
ncbi:MAG: ATP-binding protein [Chloroflexi bacterium]|nr:ATP-binding protein [Chloroflexota bacterium]